MSGTSSPQPTLAVRGFNSGLAWTPLRKHAGERGEEGTIGRPRRGALFLPSEHGELMSQHEQLDVFGDLAAPASDKQPQHSREGEIGEGKQHPLMLPEPTTGNAGTSNLGF